MIALIVGLMLCGFGLIEQYNGMAVEECTNIILVGIAFVLASGYRIRQ